MENFLAGGADISPQFLMSQSLIAERAGSSLKKHRATLKGINAPALSAHGSRRSVQDGKAP